MDSCTKVSYQTATESPFVLVKVEEQHLRKRLSHSSAAGSDKEILYTTAYSGMTSSVFVSSI